MDGPHPLGSVSSKLIQTFSKCDYSRTRDLSSHSFKITTVHTFIDRCQKRVGGAHLAGPAEMVLMFTVSDQGEYQVSDGEKCAKSSGHCLFLLKRYIFSSAHLAHTLACYLVAHSTQEQVDNLGDLYQVGPCNYTMIPTLHVMACKQHPEYHCHKRLFDVLHAVATWSCSLSLSKMCLKINKKGQVDILYMIHGSKL